MGHLEPNMSELWIHCKDWRIVLKFCTMKEAKRDMGIILMVFLKEIFWKKSVFPSVRNFSQNWLISFFWIFAWC